MIYFEKLKVFKKTLYFLVLDETALSTMRKREGIKGILGQTFWDARKSKNGQTNWELGMEEYFCSYIHPKMVTVLEGKEKVVVVGIHLVELK